MVNHALIDESSAQSQNPPIPQLPSLPHVDPHIPFQSRPERRSLFANGPIATGGHDLINMLTDAHASSARAESASPLFNILQGGDFLGTSQMPSEPSQRTMLSIGQIREGGTNITARLSLIEKPSVRRAYTGVIEGDELILIPKRKQGVIPMFLTRQPWHSNSPTRITLFNDGKSLTGTSVSGERFEFLPRQQETSQADGPHGLSPGENGPDSRRWQLRGRHSSSQSQIWRFRRTGSNRGNFLWYQGDAVKHSGRYIEDRDLGHLDLILNGERPPKSYLVKVQFAASASQAATVCVAKSGARRPPRVDPGFGRVLNVELISN